jgi:hypothetical protein
MKTKSKLSIFALHQRLSRPGTTIVLAVFTLGFLMYLCTLLAVNMQKGWYAEVPGFYQERPDGTYDRGPYREIYTFEYYFKGYDFSGYRKDDIEPLTAASTTHYLVHTEIVFLASLFGVVLALILTRFKLRKSDDTINRLSLSKRSIYIMQWLSDFLFILYVWLAHLASLFLFYLIYMHLAPAELTYPQNLYSLFAGERYLYMLFPVLNPISAVRMLSLVLSVSFLPSIVFFRIKVYRDNNINIHIILTVIMLVGGMLAGLICWGFFQKGHVMSIIACASALVVALFFVLRLPKGETFSAAEPISETH